MAEDRETLVHIGDLAHLRGTSTRRPLYACPACGEKVRPRVGRKRRPHFAHVARDDCWALTEEGRLHLEAKYHIARELRLLDPTGRGELGLAVRCGEDGSRLAATPDLFRCPATDRHRFGDWVEVLVEKRDSLTNRRPDIKLVDADGDTVLAIEIVHTNDVDEEKAAEWFSAGVPWVEFDVSGEGFSRTMGWTHEQPDLPCSRASVDFAWRCEEHGRAEAPVFFRLVDSYFPAGGPWEDIGFRRDVYWVVRCWDQGCVVSNSLHRIRGAMGQEHLGVVTEGTATVRELFAQAQRHASEEEPDSTERDVGCWSSLEHIPVQARLPYLLRAASDLTAFPARRCWSSEKGRYVWAPPKGPMSARDLEIAAHAFVFRLRGYERPWSERPRDPYDVPVIPSGLRAAWLGDQLAEAWAAHMSGERLIPGVEPCTEEEFWAAVRGDRPLGAGNAPEGGG